MKKKSVQQYVEELKRGAGVDRAIKIAENCMKATLDRSGLPKGAIFTDKDRKGRTPVSERELSRLQGFWTQCFHLLKKDQK